MTRTPAPLTPSAHSCTLHSRSETRLLEQAHLIGAHHLQGEWWTVATLLHTARHEPARYGSWSQFCAEIPISRMHAWRLILIAEHGLAHQNHTYRQALREALGYNLSPTSSAPIAEGA